MRMFSQNASPLPSTSSSALSTPTNSLSLWWQRVQSSNSFRWFQRLLRVGRVAFIVISVYGIGVQSGYMKYANYPEETETEMILSTLPTNTTMEQIQHMNSLVHSREYKRVQRIMENVLRSARAAIETRLQILDPVMDAEQYELLIHAKKKLSGHWDLVMFPSNDVNAYVSGVCPKKIFLFTGLLKALHPTDDELAVVIGHEISHIILAHNESNADFTAFLLALQLLVFSFVDPLGVSVMVFDYITDLLRKGISASYSRSNENEADALGIEIAANACYDVVHGIGVMQKLAMVAQHIPIPHPLKHASDDISNVSHDNSIMLPKRSSTSWFDSHPSSEDRYDTLQKKVYEMIREYPGNQTTPSFPNQKLRYRKPPHCTMVLDFYRSYAALSDQVMYKSKIELE